MIYAFYSYKGGVGRSMALANTAELLYQAGWRVLMIDWDLEAPGLERYFQVDSTEILKQPGLIDMLLDYKEQMAHKLPIASEENEVLPFEKPAQFAINLYPDAAGPGELLLLPAGKRYPQEQFTTYAQAVHAFDWVDFYQNWEGELYFEWLREQLTQMADVILIDSRTGVTEMGGVCTQQLADTVVMFCTPNQQSIDGTYDMALRLKRDKIRHLRGGRPLDVLIVPARVEDRAEAALLNKFRDQFVDKFSEFVPRILHGELKSLWELKIPHVPYYAFDETVAVREKDQEAADSPAAAGDMVLAFTRLVRVMTRLDPKLLSYEEAVDFYLTAKTWDEAIALLDDDELKAMYHAGHAKTLDGWLAKIPLANLEQHPRLLLFWGRILNDNFGQAKRAMFLFTLAEEQFRQQGDQIGIAQAQIWQSVGLRMMGQASEAISLASQGLDRLLKLETDDMALLAWATRNRGLACGTAGDIDQALADTQYALEKFAQLGDEYKYMVGLCHHDIGVSLEKQANSAEAEEHYRQAVQIWKELNNENDLANSLIGLGEILSHAGRYEEALEQFQEGLEIALSIGAIRRAAFAQAGIGHTYFRYKDYELAIKAYNLSTGYAQDAQARSLEVSNQIMLSKCFYYLTQPPHLDETLEKAREAGRIAAENGLLFEKGLACLIQAKIHIRLEQYGDGFNLLDEAVAYFVENNIVEHVKARLWWAYNLYLTGSTRAALIHLKETIDIALSIKELELHYSLEQTTAEVSKMLHDFLEQEQVPDEVKNSIELLLKRYRNYDPPPP